MRNYNGAQVWLGSAREDQRDASGLLYRRNRYYDPSTGRFTQEDPIGLAGGLNLYGFADGDPMTYDDPFGLAVCAKDRALQRGVERAVNATITWDANGCVSSMNNVQFHGGSRWRPLQVLFTALVTDPAVFTLAWRNLSNPCVNPHWTSQFQPGCRTAFIDPVEVPSATTQGRWYYGDYKTCNTPFWRSYSFQFYDLPGLIAHELIGHGSEMLGYGINPKHPEAQANGVENDYHRAAGRRLRCRG